MTKINKLIALLLSLVMFLLAFSGCGKKEKANNSKIKSKEKGISSQTENGEIDDFDVDDFDGDVFDDFNVEDDEEFEDWGDDEEEVPDSQKPTNNFLDVKFNKYKYVWGDEFNGTTLDTNKFEILAHSNTATDLSIFNGDNANVKEVFSIGNGTANMFFKRWYDPYNSNIQYAQSGGLNTKNTMSYRYGYLEMRAKMTFQKDKNSFWLVSKNALNSNSNNYCNLEIDIFETLASFDSVTPNIHRWFANGDHTDYNEKMGQKKPFTYFDTYELSKEFHTYGFLWTPTEISMFVDDEKYFTLDTTKSFDDDPDTTCFNLPMYIMVTCGAFTPGNNWHSYSGDEVNVKNLPLNNCVDYIRLYQNPEISGNLLNLK